MKKINFTWWRVSILLTLIGVLFVFVVFFMGISANRSGHILNKKHNAVWAGHELVKDYKSKKDVQDFVNNLSKHQIDTVFVHAGPIEKNGSINPRTYSYAISFLEYARQFNKDIKYQAWLGQVRGKIDLSDEKVRHNIARECMILGQFAGFDGIHFDIEPVYNDDENFIKVLKECRGLLPKDKKISVSLAAYIPDSFVKFVENIAKFDNVNSDKIYTDASKYADQIVVMTYDKGMDSAWMYARFVKEQTIMLSDLLEGKELFMGIPAYEDVKEGFDPKFENIENGLKGVIEGLNDIRSSEENFAGVAIYPYWEMTDEKWRIYDKLWLK
ncbi:hypothetical protein HZC20_03260 [Candidatus Peregrinibacteria bacterium]|nr:hypothetical protein [Candidatus Peregrinibacteria bacterium]